MDEHYSTAHYSVQQSSITLWRSGSHDIHRPMRAAQRLPTSLRQRIASVHRRGDLSPIPNPRPSYSPFSSSPFTSPHHYHPVILSSSSTHFISPLSTPSFPSSRMSSSSTLLPSNVTPSPLFVLPRDVPSPQSITSLAVYGTLRDDDDSGAPWTSAFVANRTSALPGVVRGVRLFHITDLHYPCAILSHDVRDHIHVRVLEWDVGAFAEKLKEADQIEGYTEGDEEGSEYVRRKVDVELGGEGEGGEGVKPAWIYVATKLEKFGAVEELPHGDWMRRTRRKGERGTAGAWTRAHAHDAV